MMMAMTTTMMLDCFVGLSFLICGLLLDLRLELTVGHILSGELVYTVERLTNTLPPPYEE